MNRKISCVVIDDEPLGKELVINFVNTISFLALKKSFDNPVEALAYLKENSVDLIITDIDMPTISGIDLIKSLKQPPSVIFITAYRDFAVEGFENGVIDFLVKPVAYHRFVTAIDRARERVESAVQHKQPDSHSLPDHIFVKTNGKLVKIILENIIYVEALGDYLKIVTEKESFTTLATLKSMESVLQEPVFSRVQRSFIVKISAVKSISGNVLELSDGKAIPVAANKKDEVFALLGL